MKNVEFTTDELVMMKHSLEQAIRDYQSDIVATMSDAELGYSKQQMAVEWYQEEINKTSALLFKIVQQVPVWR